MIFEFNTLAEKLGITFESDENILQAFTHRSKKLDGEDVSYERLEFLGDSALNTMVAKLLYLKGHSEGEMSQWRSRLVKGEQLAQEFDRLNLETYLIIGQSMQNDSLSVKIKSSVFEALIGVLFLQGGLPLIEKAFLQRFESLSEYLKKDNYKGLLQEKCAQKKYHIKYIDKTDSTDKKLSKITTVLKVRAGENLEIFTTHGVGGTKKIAHQMAAQKMLAELQKMKL